MSVKGKHMDRRQLAGAGKCAPGAGWFDASDGPIKGFAEVLLLGVVFFILSIPVVTVGPALIVVLNIRSRERSARRTTIRQAWQQLVASWRTAVGLTCAILALIVLVAVDLNGAQVRPLPGGDFIYRAMIAGSVVVAAAIILTAAVHVSSGLGLGKSSGYAFDLTMRWPGRVLGLVGGVATMAAMCWIQPALICVAMGPLIFAADAVVWVSSRFSSEQSD